MIRIVNVNFYQDIFLWVMTYNAYAIVLKKKRLFFDLYFFKIYNDMMVLIYY
jgi:hypothetical protein